MLKKIFFFTVMSLNIFAYEAQDLFEAIRNEDTQMVDMILIDNPELANAANEGGFSALRTAVVLGNSEIVRSLLDAGAPVDLGGLDGITPLMSAAYENHLLIFNLLLARGASVNASSNKNYTALMHAALGENEQAMKELLRRGADIFAKNNEGKSVDHYVKDNEALKKLVDDRKRELELEKEAIIEGSPEDALFQSVVAQALTDLQKYDFDAFEYRRAAQILYTLARRIASVYRTMRNLSFPAAITFGDEKSSEVVSLDLPKAEEEKYPQELIDRIVLESFHPGLVGLTIKTKSGTEEDIISIVEDYARK
jgi:uncharacterized protein